MKVTFQNPIRKIVLSAGIDHVPVSRSWLYLLPKKITMEGRRTISNILIYLSLPCVIINSFLPKN